MAYRRTIYVTELHMRGKVPKRYATFTLKTIADKLRIVYDINIKKSRLFDEESAPFKIYEERTEAYKLEIHKLVCA